MSKSSNREKILVEGLKVVHARGFANASVRDIVQAAGVPQGSFTNHFVSKEAFGLEIIELYYANTRVAIESTLLNEALPPLQRLEAYVDASASRLAANAVRNGCLFGNFAAEACDGSEPIRLRLVAIFAEVESAVATCLRVCVAAGTVAPDLDCDATAGFVVSSLQGANLLAKAERSAAPVARFKQVLFSRVLGVGRRTEIDTTLS